MTTETRQLTGSEQEAKAQYESIREMVAALNCDYDRLEELRDEADSYENADESRGGRNHWQEDNPDEAEELAELESAATIDGELQTDNEQARERIQEDPLSVQVRSGWHNIGEELTQAEFEILLCTGGPACRIRGELDEAGYPDRAWLEHQDWGTPWTQYFDADQDTLLAYCREFCFER